MPKKFISKIIFALAFFTAFSFSTSAKTEEAFSDTDFSKIETSVFSEIKDVSKPLKIPDTVILGGETFGVKVKSSGVIVIDYRDILKDGENKNPARESGIRTGDIITEVDGVKIESGNDFRNKISSKKETQTVLTYTRNDKVSKTKVTPVYDKEDGEYHIGIIVKDSTAGLGTVTFYDKENNIFGALGHGICEGETLTLYPLEKSFVCKADVYSVEKGVSGKAGELRGLFLDDKEWGSLYANTESGVFGTLTKIPEKPKVKVAAKNEIKEGDVKILSTVDEDGVKEYSAKITKVDMNEKSGKNFTIEITDETLLSKTGGIVQGMSGSPIIQNGKLVGAVTHVLINDPKSGFGISAEKMLKTAYGENIDLKSAA